MEGLCAVCVVLSVCEWRVCVPCVRVVGSVECVRVEGVRVCIEIGYVDDQRLTDICLATLAFAVQAYRTTCS